MESDCDSPSMTTRSNGALNLRVFACQRCFRRKQRCDRLLPICSQCKTADAICHDSEKENSVTQLNDKEIARKGYLTLMEERIAFLEAEATKRGLATKNVPEMQGVVNEGAHSISRNQGTQRSAQTSARQHKGNVSMSSLTLNAMAEPPNRAAEFLRELSMPRIIARVTEIYGGNPEISTRLDSLWDGIAKYSRRPVGQGSRLHIQAFEATKYLKIYMDIVDFRFPRLPVKKVQRGLDAITCQDENTYEAALSETPAYIFMAYMVIAIVSLVSEDFPVAQGSFVSIHVLAHCLGVLDQVFTQDDGVDIIQCLHLLVVFSIHSSAAGSAWHLIGFAMNKCIALGYHREPSLMPSNHSTEDPQQRKWAFWSCYFLDRLISGALGRPFSINDHPITVSLPGEMQKSISHLNPSESFYCHLFRYAIVLSSVTTHHTAGDFDTCLGQVLQWQASTTCRWDRSFERVSAHQTSLYNTLLLRIAIKQIPEAYDFGEFENCTGPIRYVDHESNIVSYISTRKTLLAERRRVQRLKLLAICGAVSQSLNRPTMAQRPFLSMITGYSAFSLALAIVYCYALTNRGRNAGIFESLADDLPNKHQCDNGHNGDGSGLQNDRDVQNTGTNSIGVDHQDELTSIDRLLDMACERIDVVGRQFPRMQDFRKMIDLFRLLANLPGDNPGNSLQDERTELKKMILGIGPCHSRELAQAILFLLQ